MLTVNDLKAGDVVFYWHDAGCAGNQPYYAMIEKATPKRVRVIGERGERGIKRPEFFYAKCSPQTVAELKADYPKWPMWRSDAAAPISAQVAR